MGEQSPGTLPNVKTPDERLNDRLDSWKEIAAYLNRDVTTVQRWEKREAMPVHRHLHDSKGSVYASRAELDDWVRSRNLPTSDPIERAAGSPSGGNGNAAPADGQKETQRTLPRTVRRWVVSAAAFACLMLVVAGWFANESRRDSITGRAVQTGLPQTPNLLTERRLTSNSPEAPVDFAVVSPDGKFVAYSDPTGLYLRVIASGEIRRWDLPKGFIAKPNSWFPDGTHLLVMRWEGSPPTPSLWKLSLLGGSPQKLITHAVSGAVSPDGSRLVFGSLNGSWGSELWVMNADGSNPHKIAEANHRADPGVPSGIVAAAWSPDGRRIACIERYGFAGLTPATGVSTLWTLNADGTDLQIIFKNKWLGPAISWAPDGRILFSSRSDPAQERDDEDVHSIRVDEGTGNAIAQEQTVSTGAGSIRQISITSNGKHLILARTNSREQAFISEFDAHTRKWKTPRRLTLDANGNQATAWLSDSRTVLFVSNRNGTWTLYKQAIDETTADVLVEGHSLYLPRLSADGSQVLYGSQKDPADPTSPVSLMRLPVAGGPPQLVVRDVGLGNYQCARLPSTLCIVHKPEKGDCVFFAFDPERGIEHELFRTHDGCHDWSLSPDGGTLSDFPDHSHNIRFFSIKHGVVKEDRTFGLSGWPFGAGDWSADSTVLWVPDVTQKGIPVLLEVSRTGKASVALAGDPSIEFDYVIQAPDGRHAIIEEVVPSDNNLWMVDDY